MLFVTVWCLLPISEHPLFFITRTTDRVHHLKPSVTRNVYILRPDKTKSKKKPKPNGQREHRVTLLFICVSLLHKLVSGKERERERVRERDDCLF